MITIMYKIMIMITIMIMIMIMININIMIMIMIIIMIMINIMSKISMMGSCRACAKLSQRLHSCFLHIYSKGELKSAISWCC